MTRRRRPCPDASSRQIGRLADFAAGERGAITVFALALLLLAMTVGGLAVDYANAVRAREHLRAVTDAAALAAARDLPDTDAARQTALEMAELNAPPSLYGEVLVGEDVVFGVWNNSDRSFTPNVTPFNAVSVRTRRTSETDNAEPAVMLGALRKSSWDLNSFAIAVGLNDCSGGLFAGDQLKMEKDNLFTDGFCIYAKEKLNLGENNTFEPGTVIQVPEDANFKEGKENEGVDQALRYGERELPLASNVDNIVADLMAGDMSGLPSWITAGPVYLDKIEEDTPLTPGTFYIVSGKAKIEDQLLDDIAIVAEKIDTKEDVVIERTFLAATKDIKIGDKSEVGSDAHPVFGENDYCKTGKYQVTMFAGKKIEIKNEATLRGTLMASGEHIKMKKASGMYGSWGESMGKIQIDKADVYQGCANALTTPYAEFPYTVWGLMR